MVTVTPVTKVLADQAHKLTATLLLPLPAPTPSYIIIRIKNISTCKDAQQPLATATAAKPFA